MADVFTKKKRSEVMSLVKGKNTSPERLVFTYLRKQGIYFQRHYKRATGCPDLAIPRRKLAVFIDGGFWHGWQFAIKSKKWPTFWRKKIADNIRRDRKNRRRLRAEGWSVLRIWDHDLRGVKAKATLERIRSFLS